MGYIWLLFQRFITRHRHASARYSQIEAASKSDCFQLMKIPPKSGWKIYRPFFMTFYPKNMYAKNYEIFRFWRQSCSCTKDSKSVIFKWGRRQYGQWKSFPASDFGGLSITWKRKHHPTSPGWYMLAHWFIFLFKKNTDYLNNIFVENPKF